FGTPPMRLTAASPANDSAEPAAAAVADVGKISLLMGLPLADLLLEAMLHHPHDAATVAVQQINARIVPTMQLVQTPPDTSPPQPGEGLMILSHPLRAENQEVGSLHLLMPRADEETAVRHFLAQL